MKLPHFDAITDTVFRCYAVDTTTSPFFVRNPLSLLRQISGYSTEIHTKICSGMVENINAVTASFGEFLCPDGAFSAGKGRSMISFGGVKGSHGLFEGDIDATLMMMIARKEIYTIFSVNAPLLNTENVWAWISGEKPLPDPYCKL